MLCSPSRITKLVLCLGLVWHCPPSVWSAEPPVVFETHVAPIFRAKCVECHDGTDAEEGLDLGSSVGLAAGSDNGPVIVPGDTKASLLLTAITKGTMPPEDSPPLTKSEIGVIRQWIADGAVFKSGNQTTKPVTEHQILPILRLRCTVCHGHRRSEAELDLTSREAILKGGKSGPVIVPGDPAKSRIIHRIDSGEMPPRRELVAVSVKPMRPSELKLLETWIAQGARPSTAKAKRDVVDEEDRNHWAFHPPSPVAVPDVQNRSVLRNAIDSFTADRLEKANLTLSPEADRATLLRRAYYDLLGLPPTTAEVRQFLDDDGPLAYERLIDRLLASPRYGERWGRFWLDMAGYSDSEGIQHADRIRSHAYRYRDYVIRSFNADQPYDHFLLQQLAGDELADYENAPEVTDELAANLIATGFLRLGPDGTYANITNFVPDRLKLIDNTIEVLGSGILGLTMKCARCHSHKLEPIPQGDYYSMVAVFKGAYDEHDWLDPVPHGTGSEHGKRDRYLPYVASHERKAWEANEKHITQQVERLGTKLSERAASLRESILGERLGKLPEAVRANVRVMLATAAEQRDDAQKSLATQYETSLQISDDDLKKANEEFRKLDEETARNIKSLGGERKPEPLVRALWDRGVPSPTYILRRGDYLTPGELVEPDVPTVLADGKTPLVVEPPWPGSKKTGRRLALARWISDPRHPLTARVMVNRIWRHHFGRGIVSSIDNFGRTGVPPTHPELLDWLACEFVDHGWSVKRMHRLMMTSATYRQSSHVTDDHMRLDPDNRLFSRMPMSRMTAEALRDTLLYLAGRLDDRQFGPADPVNARADGLVRVAANDGAWRRSVYILQRRTQPHTLLESFDLPRMNPNCVDRSESNVATQALQLLNDQRVYDLAESFARRVEQLAPDNPEKQVRLALLMAFGRPPPDEQHQISLAALSQFSTTWRGELAQNPGNLNPAKEAQARGLTTFCHALFNSAALLYID